jgi:ABC-type enterochelin transport system substrate-binding protein
MRSFTCYKSVREKCSFIVADYHLVNSTNKNMQNIEIVFSTANTACETDNRLDHCLAQLHRIKENACVKHYQQQCH